MNSIVLSLEEIEYILIKSNSLYFFGFDDCFLKYEKTELFRRFEKIADSLEGKDIINREFNGRIELKGQMKEIIDTILSARLFYDITIAKYGELYKRYRIFIADEKYSAIEIESLGDGKLDYNNVNLYFCNLDNVVNILKNNLEHNYKITDDDADIIEISNEYVNELKNAERDKLNELNVKYYVKENSLTNDLHNALNNTKEILSISMIDMRLRKSKVNVFLSYADKMIKMRFKLKGAVHNWILQRLDDDGIKKELNNIMCDSEENV